jgi:hypothetical protein
MRSWLGLGDPGTCPVHGTPLTVIEADDFLSYRCDQSGCQPAESARRLGQYMIAGVLDRLPHARFGDGGIEADCPACGKPICVGVRGYEPDGYPLLLVAKERHEPFQRLTDSDPTLKQEESRLLQELEESSEESRQAAKALVAAACWAGWAEAKLGADSTGSQQAAEGWQQAAERDERARARYTEAQRAYADLRDRLVTWVPASIAQQAEKAALDRYISIQDDTEAEEFLAQMERFVVEEAARLDALRQEAVCRCSQDDILAKVGLTPGHARWSGWPEYWDGYKGGPQGFSGFPGNSLNDHPGNIPDSRPWYGTGYAESRIFEDFKDGSAEGREPSVWESPRPLDGDVKV